MAPRQRDKRSNREPGFVSSFSLTKCHAAPLRSGVHPEDEGIQPTTPAALWEQRNEGSLKHGSMCVCCLLLPHWPVNQFKGRTSPPSSTSCDERGTDRRLGGRKEVTRRRLN